MGEMAKEVAEIAKTKKVKTWSQTTKVGDKNNEIRVEKLHNEGFLVEYRVWGEDSKGKWFDESIKEYSESNPLDKNEVNELAGMASMFSVLNGAHKNII